RPRRVPGGARPGWSARTPGSSAGRRAAPPPGPATRPPGGRGAPRPGRPALLLDQGTWPPPCLWLDGELVGGAPEERRLPRHQRRVEAAGVRQESNVHLPGRSLVALVDEQGHVGDEQDVGQEVQN